ncbi:precorrin-3B synthase, partial [Roseomonas sp. NAR14]
PPRRGWCPSLHEPMPSGDGLLSRVKPRAAILPAAAARRLAAAAAAHGNGWIDLTTRANLQIRGLTEAGAARFAEAMLAAGLADPDPGIERRRNLLAPPLLGHDPALAPGLPALVAALEAVLAAPDLAALPAKFGLLLDGGGALPLAGLRADLAIRTDGSTAWLHPDGAGRAIPCAPAEAPVLAGRLLRAFLALARAADTPPRRMRDLDAAALLAAWPDAAPPATSRAAGPPPEAPATRHRDTSPPPARPVPPAWAASEAPVGILPLGAGRVACGVAPAYGQLAAENLAALADLADRYADGTLRLTPWRVLLLPGVAADDAPALLCAATAAGLIADPADPRLGIVACPGAPACASATVATRADAARLLAAGFRARAGLLHLSGCAKGCAHPAPAPWVLVGREGAYDLVRAGRAGDAPLRAGLGPEAALAGLADAAS